MEALRLFDLAAFSGAAFVARGASNLTQKAIHAPDVVMLFCCLAAWSMICVGCGLYHSRRMSGMLQDVRDIVNACMLAGAAMLAIARAWSSPLAAPAPMLIFLGSSSTTLIGGRLLIKAGLHRVRAAGRNLRYVLIAGANQRSLELAKALEDRPELGYRVQGFADVFWDGAKEAVRRGYRIVSSLEDLGSYIGQTVVDEVLVCLPIQSMYRNICSIASACAEQGIPVRIVADFFNPAIAVNRSDQFEGTPILALGTRRIDGWSALAKTAFDRIAAFLLIVWFSPLMAAIAVAIKLTSRGPVIFRQKRLGLNKRPFEIYKFRTMVVDAEQKMAQVEKLNEMNGPVFKVQNDPRVTPLGRVLRRLSLDELPQLFNVLIGDMSLVGPRPLPLRDYAGFSTGWHRRRLSVRPGISCLWQVEGRNTIPFDRWMELDRHYIDHWSFWLDLKILWKTVLVVLMRKGAC